ncbi:DUF2924 domain-containing protein [Sphingosinicella sp. GR2756]|uniref:DUF2924 domain-containing protein n=1 Tax=Sphingosinicella rhizophila TaxID=3050082 RepID=A0ABU3QCL4_9SPHN|nr:DUF2924 domain-containing protein [Sphingosinicella sp. GR2756]
MTRAVEALEKLDLEALRKEWRTRFGPPPPLRSVPLLRLSLAWRIQAAAHGGLSPEVRRQLKRKGAVQAEGLGLGAGAKLRREWNGKVVEVEVEEKGFRWNGTLYPSLSSAATAIAGTRWNGPRFFGLRETRS